jgi:uncharacterized protein YbaR (Trm112 family)
MHASIREKLECPLCHADLDWQIERQDGTHIETAEAVCSQCGASYPVREGIAIFLTPDLPRNDLWEQLESNLSQHLREHPDLEHRLMDPPFEQLSPTDTQLRALMLDERGEFVASRKAEAHARQQLYTEAYLECWECQTAYVIKKIRSGTGPVIDLASGRGYLVERIASELDRPVVATDFSLNVLRRDRRYFEHLELYTNISLMAFDARRTPFKNDSIETLTTNLGFPNIENPASMLAELKRIVRDELLAVSFFFPEDDEPNRLAIEDAGLTPLLYKQRALELFREVGWQVNFENVCQGEARPTPLSEIFDGVRADGLPVAPTVLEWGVLRGNR